MKLMTVMTEIDKSFELVKTKKKKGTLFFIFYVIFFVFVFYVFLVLKKKDLLLL